MPRMNLRAGEPIGGDRPKIEILDFRFEILDFGFMPRMNLRAGEPIAGDRPKILN